MEKFTLTSIIWKEHANDTVYVSKCPELDVASFGDTQEDTGKNLLEAVELYLENAKELGILDEVYPLLQATDKTTTKLTVEI